MNFKNRLNKIHNKEKNSIKNNFNQNIQSNMYNNQQYNIQNHKSYFESRNILKLNKMNTDNQPASRKKRFMAGLIDVIIYLIPIMILNQLFIMPTFNQLKESPAYTTGGLDFIFKQMLGKFIVFSIVCFFIFLILYIIIPCYIFEGQTLGKRIMKIKLIKYGSLEQQPLSFGTYLLREVIGKTLSGLLLIGYFMILFTKEYRGLHDLIANSYVISDEY